MTIYDSKKAYCNEKINKYSINGDDVLFTEVKLWGDCIVFKKGFCFAHLIDHSEPDSVINDYIKNNKMDKIPQWLNVLDLICHGDFDIVENCFFPNWFYKYSLGDSEGFKLMYDCLERFKGKFYVHADKLCLPYIEITETNEIIISLYCVDDDITIISKPLKDICYDIHEYECFNGLIKNKILHTVNNK